MDIVIVVVSGIAGILIGQANGILDRRYEKRKALNTALSELLEIRHRFKGSMYFFRILAQEINLPYAYYDEVISKIPDGLLWDEKISSRYNQAVDIIAMHSPILSYILRSKEIVGLLCNGAPIKFGETKESHEFALEIISHLELSMTPAIDETIESLAILAGRKTHKQIAKLLSETQEVPEEVKQLTNQIILSLAELVESAADKPLQPSADAPAD